MNMVRAGARRQVVVVDADEIYRAGVVEWCAQQPEIDVVACCDPAEVAMTPLACSQEPLTVLIEVSGRPVEPDQYSGVTAIAQLRHDLTPAQARIVATCRLPASRYLALRLAEAGADFYYGPLHRFASGADLVRAVCEPSEGCRLPTKWALREELGLRWDGDLAAFLEAIADCPAELWQDGRRQVDLPVSRRGLRRLRQLAHELAGVPPPDFRRFTGSLREPPTLPEWQEVCWFVRALRGG